MRAASKARTADTAAAHGAQSRDSPDFFGNMVDTIGRVGTHLMRSSDQNARSDRCHLIMTGPPRVAQLPG
jgi:hypothetical protein